MLYIFFSVSEKELNEIQYTFLNCVNVYEIRNFIKVIVRQYLGIKMRGEEVVIKGFF